MFFQNGGGVFNLRFVNSVKFFFYISKSDFKWFNKSLSWFILWIVLTLFISHVCLMLSVDVRLALGFDWHLMFCMSNLDIDCYGHRRFPSPCVFSRSSFLQPTLVFDRTDFGRWCQPNVGFWQQCNSYNHNLMSSQRWRWQLLGYDISLIFI